MDNSAKHSRTRRCLAALAFPLLSLMCAAGAPAQDAGAPPTVAEAHAFLADTFLRYSVGYEVWRNGSWFGNKRGRAGYYGGRDCYSEVGTGTDNRVFAVDWSVVSSVERSGQDAIYVSGQLLHSSSWNPYGRRDANFHLYFPDAGTSRSVLNALEFLRSACRKRSKFD